MRAWEEDTLRGNALISVTDKTGVGALAAALREMGYNIISTGGTAELIRDARVEVLDVASFTGRSEILGGSVKTLDYSIHGALAADLTKPAHVSDLEEEGLTTIDILVVNLYDYSAKLESAKSFAELVESIDVGGHAMIRCAAKNYQRVAVVTSPIQHPELLRDMYQNSGVTSLALREEFMYEAFRRIATYDNLIADSLPSAKARLESED